jgi:hypothetical protein
MLLTWAYAEYIKLCASLKNKFFFDMPAQTQQRYIKQKLQVYTKFDVNQVLGE